MQIIWKGFDNDPAPISIDVTGTNLPYVFSVNPTNGQLNIMHKNNFSTLSVNQRSKQGFYVVNFPDGSFLLALDIGAFIGQLWMI